MKKLSYIFSALLFMFLHVAGHAQNLAVESFALAETDLTANTPGTIVHDQNGEVCALIKVETTQKGFTFDVGVLGISEVREEPGEVWVYVPFGVRKITIRHSLLGVLRDYAFPCRIDKGRTYVMKLTSANVRTIVENVPTKQFVCFELDPADAFLEVNGRLKTVDNGVYQELLSFGKYSYRVSAENYHDLEGSFELNDPENTYIQKLKLKPAFGYVSVLETKQPDIQGAAVYIDNKSVGRIPVRNLQLSSGGHTIRIMKEMYQIYNGTFSVSDEQNVALTPVLAADFAEVTLVTAEGADIYVNGEKKGTGSWKGKISNGSCNLESRRSGHIPYAMEYEITPACHGTSIQIQGPTPIYGQLAVSSTPVGAQIQIDGRDVGNAPKYIAKQVIGKYTVTASLDGYQPQTKEVTVSEGQEASLAFTLEKKPQTQTSAKASAFESRYSDSEIIPLGYVEVKPTFQGGDVNSFTRWVANHLVYPEIARENGVQGKGYVKFVVGTDGYISNIQVARRIDPALDQEAARVISLSPKWTPGKRNGKPVPVSITIPVVFLLN